MPTAIAATLVVLSLVLLISGDGSHRFVHGQNNTFNGTNPLANVTNPLANVTNPFANATNPFANVTNPLANVTNPLANVTNPLANVTNPRVNATNPTTNSTTDSNTTNGSNNTTGPDGSGDSVNGTSTMVPSDVASDAVSDEVTGSGGTGRGPGPDGCYNNLTNMYNDIKYGDPFKKSVFVVCPDTIYKIGYLDNNNACCDNADEHHPIVIRKNVEYLCGEDGKSSNNCTLVGGRFQLFSIPPDWQESIENVILRGFTFSSAINNAVLIANAGYVLIEDCIIRVSTKQTRGVSHFLLSLG
jgi:hypothetical protein